VEVPLCLEQVVYSTLVVIEVYRGSNMHDLYFGLYSRGGTLVYYKHEIHTDFPAKRRKYFH